MDANTQRTADVSALYSSRSFEDDDENDYDS
jgi:hypothetical protein